MATKRKPQSPTAPDLEAPSVNNTPLNGLDNPVINAGGPTLNACPPPGGGSYTRNPDGTLSPNHHHEK